MSVVLTINGNSYDYPSTGDQDWGPEATDWAVAVTNGLLQKTGGLFQLLSEVDFGSGFGIKSIYYKSRTSNISTAGVLRLAVTDGIYWRNNANDANLGLTIDGSNNILFNGLAFGGTVLGVDDTSSINMSLNTGLVSGVVNLSVASASANNQLVNISIETDGLKAQILNSAIFAALPNATSVQTGLLTSADWTTFNNKLTSLSGDVSSSGTGAATTTINSGVIVNSMVNASAAIAVTKLAAITASRAVVSDGSGFISPATTTATEIGYVNGVTSSIQSQLNGKFSTSVLSAKGSLIGASAAAVPADVPVGTNGQIITANSAQTNGLQYVTFPLTNWATTSSSVVPSASFGTPSGFTAFFRRVGDSVECRGYFVAGSTISSVAYLDVPWEIDYAKTGTRTNSIFVGYMRRAGSGNDISNIGCQSNPVFFDGSDTDRIFFSVSASGTAFVKASADAIFGADLVGFYFMYPVSGWSASLV